MKLREDIQKNQIFTHGSMYVDHNEFVPILTMSLSSGNTL